MNIHNLTRGDKASPALSPLHQAARGYAAKGWPVFPCLPNDKSPAVDGGYKAATTDMDTIDRWWTANPNCNIGLCPEDVGLAVIDEDSAKGGDVTPLSLPDTYTVETPSGGKHYYFVGTVPPTVGKLGEHIDTRGRQSYVLVPPSVVNGKPYHVVRDRDVVALPPEIETRAASRAVASVATVHELDLPGNVIAGRTTLRNYVQRGFVAKQGFGGDETTYKVAVKLVRDFALSADTVFALMDAEWNPRCEPPWGPDELMTKIENAANYGQNEVGAFATAPASEIFKLPLDKLREDVKPGQALNAIKFADLLTHTVAPVEEVIPGLIEKGVATMLSGPGGTHKSRLALQLGLCVQAGAPVFGSRVAQATFLYLDYENGLNEIARRTQAINGRLKLQSAASGQYFDFKTPAAADDGPVPPYEPSPALATVAEEGIKLEPLYQQLYDYLRSIPGHKFVVLDSCYNVLRFVGQAKINETAVKAALNLLDYLCAATNSTILYLWHPSQAGMTRGDASGWSVAWHNTPRARLSINKVENVKDAFDLKVEKRNNGAAGQVTTLHWLEGALLPAADAGGKDRDKLLYEACIRVAVEAAETGTPITRQRNLIEHQLTAIEREAGVRPTQREVKEQLQRAVLDKRLRYQNGYGKQIAGYFPFSLDPGVLRMMPLMGGLETYQAGLSRDKANRGKAQQSEGQAAESIPDHHHGARNGKADKDASLTPHIDSIP